MEILKIVLLIVILLLIYFLITKTTETFGSPATTTSTTVDSCGDCKSIFGTSMYYQYCHCDNGTLLAKFKNIKTLYPVDINNTESKSILDLKNNIPSKKDDYQIHYLYELNGEKNGTPTPSVPTTPAPTTPAPTTPAPTTPTVIVV